MIEKIIDYSARNKFLVLTLTAFLVVWAIWAIRRVPLDAIPDLSDTQVILFTEWPGRSPTLIEDQITYPVITSLISAPKVKSVRGQSMLGLSYVYVIFEEGTDLYWARSRVLEYMQGVAGKLPEGVTPTLGPDATGVGWVYEYALIDETGRHDLAELRSFQDWTLRYWLQSVPGVAEVASVGGFVKQYQVNVDPNRLAAYRIPLHEVISAIRASNNDVGGRVLEQAGREYIIRGQGYIRSTEDIRGIPLGTDGNGTPIRVSDIANVAIGPDIRRGAAELDGKGEVVGGIVVMRFGENALNVIDRVKEKIKAIEPSLPEGVKIVPTYDRSDLIQRAIETLKHTLTEELLIVSLVILLFLWHLPSAIVPIVTIPIAVILSFIPMYYSGLTSNIMSLAGIAISIGVLVDGAIVEVENAYKKLERWESTGRVGDYHEVRLKALKEVGPSVFFSLLVVAVAFIPIFTLQGQEGRLFKPLAFTKNLTMAIAAVLAITFDPAMRMLFTRMNPFIFRPKWLSRIANPLLVGKYYPEERHPISRPLQRIYHPILEFVLRHRWPVVISAFLIVLLTIPIYLRLGSEFMPPLNEGTILYMPTTLPGISITEATRILRLQDRMLKEFPEVERVFGKIGEAKTATDPAPLSMGETVITLKPKAQWREGMTWDKLIAEMDGKLQFPGVANIWWMPIQTRTEMLATGIRSNIGIKVLGPDLEEINQIGRRIEGVLAQMKETRSSFFERVTGGYYLDFVIDRNAAARYGLRVDEIQEVIETAIGGKNISQTVEGRERYPINVRYAREFRDDIEKLKRVLVPTPAGAQIPMAQLAQIEYNEGPSMVKNENGMLAGIVFVDTARSDLGGYVKEAQRVVAEKVKLPPGYSLVWAGQYEYLLRAREHLKVVLPLTLFIIFLLLYLNTGSAVKTLIVLLAVPFSAVGAILFLFLLDYNMSIGVWVGLIALMGLDAETGVFMLLYLDLAYEDRKAKGLMRNAYDLKEAITEGAVHRLRPKVMTVSVMLLGLLPIMWSTGTGSDLMRRIAAPMIGGILTSFILELLVYPVIYEIWRERELKSMLK
ncbi:efflux RND transporter permease subunit [Candidatus Manganitrophus noduliformans]|uniref:Efflux RND transporter permease subunit n=1 Tax=Candidatus Manganitrophus noduliformans TaxID=2606439 RepID=A0A7X6DPZ1_9BACT|nr:CusA/CzcA family heavy metal efflux RND transporter [Candidatus Manganitrophus noduliformans]NKE71137.1 efflux RND transporter permease subunit [Candidatus Manganitrophus noduliformans]